MAQLTDFQKPGSVPEKETLSIIMHALAMYKGAVLYGIIAMLIYVAGSYLIQNAIGFDSVNMVNEIRNSDLNDSDLNYWDAPGFSTYIALSGIFGLLLSPLYIGLIYMADQFNSRNPVRFSDLFIGYRRNFINIIIYAIIASIISGVAAFFCVIPFFFVYPFLLLGYPILTFEKVSAIEALTKSVAIAKENYGALLGVTCLGLLMSVIGIILCGIGIVLTAPFFTMVMYSAYCAFLGKPTHIP